MGLPVLCVRVFVEGVWMGIGQGACPVSVRMGWVGVLWGGSRCGSIQCASVCVCLLLSDQEVCWKGMDSCCLGIEGGGWVAG